MKTQDIGCSKICESLISDKGLVAIIYKALKTQY